MSINVHNTGAPIAAAGVSCVIGFDLHAALGIAGQIVGLLSGVLSISWVAYQFLQAIKRKQK